MRGEEDVRNACIESTKGEKVTAVTNLSDYALSTNTLGINIFINDLP